MICNETKGNALEGIIGQMSPLSNVRHDGMENKYTFMMKCLP